MRTVFSLLRACVPAMFLCFTAGSASAVPVTATLTADNHYALYYGNADGSGMTFVGMNEIGAGGDPGEFNWSLPETFTFETDADYIYIVAWSDDVVAQGLIGQFNIASGLFVTGTNGWEVAIADEDLDDGSPAPATGVLSSFVFGATWGNVTNSLPNGAAPWGTVPGVATSAAWIWGGELIGGGLGGREYQVFRFRPAGEEIPEPASVALLLTGLLALAVQKRRSCGAHGARSARSAD